MIDKEYIDKHTVFSTTTGSVSYGLNTPESDVDVRGIAIIDDPKYYFGFLDRFEQFDDPDVDMTTYDIRKAFLLMADGNPNCLEMLYTKDEFRHKVHPLFERVLENRDKFLSRNVRFRYTGYSFSQLKRIKTHRGWLLNPPGKKPERSDYGLPNEKTLTKDDMNAFYKVMANLFQNTAEYTNLSESTKEELEKSNWFGLVQRRGVPDNCFQEVQQLTGATDQWMDALQKEQAYNNAKKAYQSYQQWKNNRNPKRAELEAKFGYDCYSDDTEFLTYNGWKKFDDIKENDLLATVATQDRVNQRKDIKLFQVEYQKYTDKFDSIFTGNMYNLYGNHIDVLTTPNHRMLYRKVKRASGKEYNWQLEEASSLPDTFDIVRTITPNTKNYKNHPNLDNLKVSKEAFIRLLGWYLSDGTINFRDNKPRAIVVSQKSGGRLHNSMSKFASKYDKCSLYKYKRHPNDFNPNKIEEVVLSVRNGKIVNLIHECLDTGEKRIPRWIFTLSKRMMEILLDAMALGDGTFRNDNSIIYYTSIKGLADDMQELALLCGFETSLYGPYSNEKDIKGKIYKSTMYQVHINKTRSQTKRMIRSANIKRAEANNQRIVCFTVPNHTLITRRNGHIGIHGNCKHAMHLVRLMRMGKEILGTGKVNVWRDDREELLAIRNGAWEFDRIEAYAHEMEDEIVKLYDTSPLPKKPNKVFINNMCVDIIREYMNG